MKVRAPLHGATVGAPVLVGAVSWWLATGRSQCEVIDAGCSCEHIEYSSARVGSMTTQELDRIESVARAELVDAVRARSEIL